MNFDKTQNLLKYPSGVEEYEEELSSMQEQVIIKNKNLFNQFRKPMSSFQQWFGRGVTNYFWYQINIILKK